MVEAEVVEAEVVEAEVVEAEAEAEVVGTRFARVTYSRIHTSSTAESTEAIPSAIMASTGGVENRSAHDGVSVSSFPSDTPTKTGSTLSILTFAVRRLACPARVRHSIKMVDMDMWRRWSWRFRFLQMISTFPGETSSLNREKPKQSMMAPSTKKPCLGMRKGANMIGTDIEAAMAWTILTRGVEAALNTTDLIFCMSVAITRKSSRVASNNSWKVTSVLTPAAHKTQSTTVSKELPAMMPRADDNHCPRPRSPPPPPGDIVSCTTSSYRDDPSRHPATPATHAWASSVNTSEKGKDRSMERSLRRSRPRTTARATMEPAEIPPAPLRFRRQLEKFSSSPNNPQRPPTKTLT